MGEVVQINPSCATLLFFSKRSVILLDNNKKICGLYLRVSTDDQRDNGYSIDSQLRMIKEYCEKNDYDIVDVYNDAGHSGKDLMRPEMQRLLKDIKSKKIDKLIAIKVDIN